MKRDLRLWRASAADAARVPLRGGTGVDPAQEPALAAGGPAKVKTDRRDAMILARTLRAGQLIAVWVPDGAHEAMPDLVQLRSQATRYLRKSRQ